MTELDSIKIQRSDKFRFYPNSAQQKQLAIEFGHARWVWNTCLAWRSRKSLVHGKGVSGIDFSRELSFLKKLGVYAWLKEASATGLTWSRKPSGIPKMVAVAKDCTGRYFVSFMCEEAIPPLPQKPNGTGVDLGVKDIVVTSSGWKSGNPRHLSRYQRLLTQTQRRLARQRKGSQRWHRQRVSMAKAYARVRNTRQDFPHKLSTALIRQAGLIAMENLNVKGMMANRKLSKAIGDVGMHALKRQLEYKTGGYGVEFVQVDRWAPTSKTCSGCGNVQECMPLSIREWTCPDCHTPHDRDINVAKNILMLVTFGRSESDARGGVYKPAVAV